MDGVRAHVAGTGMTLTGAIVLEVRANISVEVFPTEKSGKSACMVCSTGGPLSGLPGSELALRIKPNPVFFLTGHQ